RCASQPLRIVPRSRGSCLQPWRRLSRSTTTTLRKRAARIELSSPSTRALVPPRSTRNWRSPPMAKPFEVRYDVEVDGTPEQTWEALTTGREVDGWWMGRTEVEPRAGGKSVTTLFGQPLEGTITEWAPPHSYTVDSGVAPDGRHMVLAYTIESAAGG